MVTKPKLTTRKAKWEDQSTKGDPHLKPGIGLVEKPQVEPIRPRSSPVSLVTLLRQRYSEGLSPSRNGFQKKYRRRNKKESKMSGHNFSKPMPELNEALVGRSSPSLMTAPPAGPNRPRGSPCDPREVPLPTDGNTPSPRPEPRVNSLHEPASPEPRPKPQAHRPRIPTSPDPTPGPQLTSPGTPTPSSP